jgi:hypothetical protein
MTIHTDNNAFPPSVWFVTVYGHICSYLFLAGHMLIKGGEETLTSKVISSRKVQTPHSLRVMNHRIRHSFRMRSGP